MSASSEDRTTTDRSGAVARAGSLICIIGIPEFAAKSLPQSERERALSMLGEVFEVYEIDSQGQAWVEKWWYEDEYLSDVHSIGLKPKQMLLVVNNGM